MYNSLSRNSTFLTRNFAIFMNKMAKAKKEIKNAPKKEETKKVQKEFSAISVDDEGRIALRIHAKPGAKKSAVVEINEEELEVAIGAAPREGAANEELISYLMNALSLRKNELQFDKGAKSRSKVVLISTKRLTIDDVRKKLENEIGS